uniref:RING-type domain-containing protein n=1 Tax=Globisporangium ultimum (strain ATCC 200006 / CBS 805.95 / DAOM BR144) TaxID=431595 RepID=K3WZZ7_GLOUD
ILSLENRTKDLIENNTKLLAKIQQLEKTEADAGAQIDALRNENTRLATQADGLTSTVNSQSSLIIGLRTTMQRLNQEDQQMNALAKKYDRCQIDFEVLKTREKLLRDEYEKLKFVMSKEKEMLMFKILDFQQQLQQRNQIGDAMEAYQSQIQQLDAKQRAWENDMSTLKVASEAAETRLHQQEEMTNRFLLEKQQFEQENNRYQEEIIRKNEELERQQAMVEKLHALSTQSHELNGLLRAQQQEADIAVLAKEKEIDTLMHKCVAQESVIDELQQRIVQMEVETQRLQAEIQKYKQLSQDETVQALQLARLKAANHDALILLEEEKRELEIRIDTLVAQLERERCAHEDDKKAMESTIQFNETRLQKLLDENCMLHEKADAPPLVQIVEKFVEPPTDKIAGDMLQLQVAYDELKQEFAHVESEYKKMVTKKYKTESFQSQVRLLQNENSELASKLGQLFAELSRERAELNTRTRENVELKSRVMDPQAIELLRKTQESLEKTVSSLVEAETSSESSFTCLQCMRLFVEPMTLAPCGHTYCSSCLTKFGDADVPSSIKCK